MDNQDKTDYSDVGNPISDYDYLAHSNVDSPIGDQHDLEHTSVPEDYNKDTLATKKQRVTPAKNIVSWISVHSKRSGLVVSPEMTNYMLSISADEVFEERDVEMFIRGYVFCTGDRLIPTMRATVNDIQSEVRNLQREGNKNADVLRSMEKQGKATEMEIAAAVATIKADMISAIRSAMKETSLGNPSEGKGKVVLKVNKTTTEQKPLLVNPTVVKPPKKPDLSISASSSKESEDKPSIIDLKRVFMEAVGIEKEIIDVLTDAEVDSMIGTNDYYEYVKELNDDDVRSIWKDVFGEAIENI